MGKSLLGLLVVAIFLGLLNFGTASSCAGALGGPPEVSLAGHYQIRPFWGFGRLSPTRIVTYLDPHPCLPEGFPLLVRPGCEGWMKENFPAHKTVWIGNPLFPDWQGYTFRTPRPHWEELSPEEQLLLGDWRIVDRDEPESPIDYFPRRTIPARAARFLAERGRLPRTLGELMGDPLLDDPEGLARRYPDPAQRERYLLARGAYNPLTGGVIELNPSAPTPGSFFLREVTDPTLREVVLRQIIPAGIGGEAREALLARGAVVWYQVRGKGGRVIAEGVEGYLPSEASSKPGTGEGVGLPAQQGG